MKTHNFYAGPSILPEFTKQKTAEAALNFAGTGLSVMEVSHRGKDFMGVMDRACTLVKELLDVPAGYEVLFLQGGASTQFCMVPYNLLRERAAYLNTGMWASKAIKEAKFFGEVIEVASSKDKNYNYIPKRIEIPENVDYFHITTNNTIFGTQLRRDPDAPVPLVADMSSDIFSRPVDISKYNIVYAGAQKNLAPSGVTLAIVKTDALGKADRAIPTMLDYRTHVDKGSMFNTPPTLPVFAALQTLLWIKKSGGVAVMEKRNIEKAKLLYDELDRNRMFMPNIPAEEDRSLMNVTFIMSPGYEELEKQFMEMAAESNIVGIKGHRSVGGFRASIYNAMPIESIHALVEVMRKLESKS